MEPAHTELRRTIGLPLLLFYGMGNIIGAGIYVLIGKVSGEAAMYAPVAFLAASIVAGLV
ncbi:MAG: amino acid permease, partial [Gammaproteobacteria bacterium]|nr:amino acid permease [Gammaproteobacteria bacterium]